MSLVRCSDCGLDKPESQVRRELTLLARMGKGGTLSGIKNPKPTGRYVCDSCVFQRETGGQEAML